eukprot:10662626-Prorocentrum_lima.AAC.1
MVAELPECCHAFLSLDRASVLPKEAYSLVAACLLRWAAGPILELLLRRARGRGAMWIELELL